jgi:hypothetical protein
MFVSCFYFFYYYFVYFHFFLFLCIYLFSFYFLFQKDSSFFNTFYNENIYFLNLYFCLIRCRSPVFPKDFFNRNGTSPGPLQWLPWPPCPALPCLSPQTNRQTPPVSLDLKLQRLQGTSAADVRGLKLVLLLVALGLLPKALDFLQSLL